MRRFFPDTLNNTVRDFVHRVGWLNVEKFVRIGAEIGTAAVLARLLDQTIFGQYQLLLSFFMVGAIASLSGFNGTLLRALAQSYDGTLQPLMRLSLRWSFVGILGLLLVGAYWYSHKDINVGRGLMASALLFPVFHLFRRWEVILHAKEAFARRAKLNSAVALVTFVSVATAAYSYPDSVLVIFLTYIGVYSIINFFLYRRVTSLLRNTSVEPGWRASGYKMLLSEVFNTAYAHADKLILSFFLGAQQLAVYAVAIMIAEGLKLLLGNVVAAYIPAMYRQSPEQLLPLLRRLNVVILGASGGLVALFWFMVPLVLPFIFSDRYLESVKYAQYYLAILPSYLIAAVWGQVLIKQKQEWLFTLSTITAGVINVLVYVLSIPYFGLWGGVLGSVVYYAVLASLYYIAAQRPWPTLLLKFKS